MDQGKATGSPTAEIVTPASHSRLPWRVDRRANTRVVCGEDDTVAATGCQSSLRNDWEANAAFIVRAVNSHHMLTNALNEIAWMDEHLSTETAREMMNIARDVLSATRDSSSSGPLMTDDSRRKDSGEVNQ